MIFQVTSNPKHAMNLQVYDLPDCQDLSIMIEFILCEPLWSLYYVSIMLFGVSNIMQFRKDHFGLIHDTTYVNT